MFMQQASINDYFEVKIVLKINKKIRLYLRNEIKN